MTMGANIAMLLGRPVGFDFDVSFIVADGGTVLNFFGFLMEDDDDDNDDDNDDISLSGCTFFFVALFFTTY